MKEAFSLLEIMLTIAVIGILVSFSLPISIEVIEKNEQRNSEINVILALRVAREKAVFGLEDSDWSVRIDSSSAIVFLGDDYNNRDTNFDQIYDLKNISMGSPIIVTFDRVTGLSTDTTINLTIDKIININQYGLVI